MLVEVTRYFLKQSSSQLAPAKFIRYSHFHFIPQQKGQQYDVTVSANTIYCKVSLTLNFNTEIKMKLPIQLMLFCFHLTVADVQMFVYSVLDNRHLLEEA